MTIIKNCNSLIQSQFLDSISNACPKEKDFLAIDNSEKYNLFKGLLNLDIFTNEIFKSIYYLEITNGVISDIQKKLSSGYIEWPEISLFYSHNKKKEKEKKEKSLKDKLLSIFLNDEDKANKIKAKLDKYNITIITKLKSLNLILEDFLGFFSETQKENITLLEELIKQLSSGPINSYDYNKEKIDNLINKFEKEAKIRNEKNKSSFYVNIYRVNKNKFKKDSEQKWIEQTEKDFSKLKILFNDDGIQALNKKDKNLLKIFLEAI